MIKKFIEILYKNTPVWFQNFIISGYGYIVFKQRYGKNYKQYYAEFNNKKYGSLETELKNQEDQLAQFLKYAVEHSLFYKELYAHIDLSNIKTVQDLKQLPIVTKEMIRSNLDKIYTINEKNAIASFTGGTTGKSLRVLFTYEDFQIRMAYLDAFKNRIGVDPFMVKKATFSGKSIVFNTKSRIFWRYNLAYKQKLYSTFHLSQTNIPYYLADLNKFMPEVVNGFVSAIFELAEFIKRTNFKLKFVPKAIFTTSETLLPIHRILIEEVFQCKVYNQYASAEGAPFVTECTSGNLHYNLDTGVIENDEDDNMIITSFTTKGTPLIRYKIGDLIKFKGGDCPCGLSHPLVDNIEGRQVDFLFTKSGDKISLSHLADVIKGTPNSIIKMQFIQNTKDQLNVLMVIDDQIYTTDHEKKMLDELYYRFGDSMKIDFKIVADIPKEKSGKYALIKNNVNK